MILQEFVTLNGLAAGQDDSVDFIPASTRGDRSFGDDQFAIDLRLLDARASDRGAVSLTYTRRDTPPADA